MLQKNNVSLLALSSHSLAPEGGDVSWAVRTRRAETDGGGAVLCGFRD